MAADKTLPVLDLAACCAPVTADVVSPDDAAQLARAFKALSDPSRVRLLSLIATQGGGEACVCDLTGFVGLSQPTVSHHMKQLVEAGLVIREQRGKWAYYKVDAQALSALGAALGATV
ncbi:MAG TPA: metalloregulator ArsR/SmtB family transcription factor [Nocardioidaceae bacterium]